MKYIDDLKKRGFIYQVSDEEKVNQLIDKKRSFYIGFDPTSDSLHLGSMFALMAVTRLAEFGMRPIILLGGGTGLIGDPSGKTEMRKFLEEEKMKENLKAIEKQIRNILPKDPEPIFVNNADWLKDVKMIDFLRNVGRHFSINRMLSQDCVKSRLEKGISYLEFSYMLLQSYDFLHLNKSYSCDLQVGGADQWGNMVMGMDLTRRVSKNDVQCFTFELMMTSNGEKMGKTASGAIWLDPKKTSPYDYYQYWVNVDDRDVKRFMYRYTYLDEKTIEDLCRVEGEKLRDVKKTLAFHATKILHGEKEAKKAKEASDALFSGNVSKMENIPNVEFKNSDFESKINMADLLVKTGMIKSKGEAKRLIKGGGVYVNSKKVASIDDFIALSELEKNDTIIRIGKKRYLKILIKN
jgi:tyrosyl-tRNA synthetase